MMYKVMSVVDVELSMMNVFFGFVLMFFRFLCSSFGGLENFFLEVNKGVSLV